MQVYSSTRELNSLQSQMGRTSRTLSTGRRINQAADDPAGLAQGRRLDAQSTSLSQAGRNLKDATSLVRVADSGLAEAHSIVARLRELAVQASNGTVSDEQRSVLQGEASSLVDEVSRIEQRVRFNDQQVFQDGKSFNIQAGDDASEQVTVDPGGEVMSALGLENIDISTDQGARDALAVLDRAGEALLEHQSGLGAMDNRLRSAEAVAEGQRHAQLATASRIEDVDIAHATGTAMLERIRMQAGIATHGRANATAELMGILVNAMG